MVQSWPGAPWAGLRRTLLLAGGGVACVFITGAGWLLGASAGVLPAGLFSGAPTGISQRCPGAPCSGLSAAVPADVLIRVPWLLESSTGAVGWLIVIGADGKGSTTLRSPELWQEANPKASSAMLKSLSMIRRLIN